MDVVVITCSRRGTASRCLPAILDAGIIVKSVLVAHGAGTSKRRALMRRIKKIFKIGLLGAIVGVRMRKWFSSPTKDIRDLCMERGVPYQEIEGLNSVEMERCLKKLSPTLGVSLGNGYIAPRIFGIPKLGMINLHTEILPDYQNARAIIWPIYCNDPYTGYTIHEIVQQIDAGRILLQRKYPICFGKSLEETVRINKAETDSRFPKDVAYAVQHIEELKAVALKQGNGKRYTTPSIWQYIRMVVNNRRLYKRQCLSGEKR